MEARFISPTTTPNIPSLSSRQTSKIHKLKYDQYYSPITHPFVVTRSTQSDKSSSTVTQKIISASSRDDDDELAAGGLTKKTIYNDSWFDKLAINYLSQRLQDATGLRNSKSGYESLAQATADAWRRFSITQQQQLVLQTLDRAVPRWFLNLMKMLPQSSFTREYFAAFTALFFVWLIGASEVRESEFNGRKEKNVVHIKKCRLLEETNCAGICANLCKMPSQTFIKNSLGMPVNMVPNFDDMSCEMIFGAEPPAMNEDPAFKQPCYKLCKAKQITKSMDHIKCSS